MLQEDTLAPYLFIICLDYVLRTSIDLMKENNFSLAKTRSRRDPSQKISYVDYVDDIALLANAPAQVESLLNSLKQTAGGIDLYVNADKIESICFNQRWDISTLNGCSLKLVDKFTYPGSNVASTENDINTLLAKAWATIDRLSVIWKSNLSDTIIRNFFPAAVVSILLNGCTTLSLTKCMEEKPDGNCPRILRAILNKSWGRRPTKSSCTATYPLHLENHSN